MRGSRNSHGATLADCSVPLTTESALFAMMAALPVHELKSRVGNIEDPDTRTLAQAHIDVLTGDWDGPIKE